MDWDIAFPMGAKIKEKKKDCVTYQVDFSDGYGIMTAFEILPGILLTFNEFQTGQGFQNEKPRPGFLEINHCRRGRFECILSNGRKVSLGCQDLSLSDMGKPNLRSVFSFGAYYGLSLLLHLETAARSFRLFLGDSTKLDTFFEESLFENEVLLLRANPKIQRIVSALYNPPEFCRFGYYRIKTLELLLFLGSGEKQWKRLYPNHGGKEAEKIEMVERIMTENLRKHHALSELAKEASMGITTLKKQFREQYGTSPYHYLKRCRMEEAAFLLQSTKLSISEIAEMVGYQNASKFSAAFYDLFQLTPREYRNHALLE